MKRVMFVSVVALVLVAMTVTANAVVTLNNVLTNGQLVNNMATGVGGVTTDLVNYYPNPTMEMYSYGTGGGLGVYQGQSTSSVIQYEVGDNYKYSDAAVAGGKLVQDGGNHGDWSAHSVICGGSAAAPGQYGVKQVFATTAGKLYLYTGVMSASKPGNVTGDNIQFDYGIQNGAVTANSGSNYDMFSNNHVIDLGFRTNTGGWNQVGNSNVRSNFAAAMIATGSQATIHAGLQDVDGMATGVNSYIDGLRVWEFDIPVYSELANGNFNNAITDLGAKVWDDQGSMTGIKMHDGWLALGFGAGNVTSLSSTSTGADSSQCLMIDMYKAQGQEVLFQRVNKGAGTYTIGGQIKTGDLTMANGQIGVDFTGGLDANSSNIVWTSTLAATGVWETKSLTGDAGANGVTIFLRTGNPNALGFTASGSGMTGQSFFDNVTMDFAPVPEPGSLLALGTGLIGLLGFIRRKK